MVRQLAFGCLINDDDDDVLRHILNSYESSKNLMNSLNGPTGGGGGGASLQWASRFFDRITLAIILCVAHLPCDTNNNTVKSCSRLSTARG